MTPPKRECRRAKRRARAEKIGELRACARCGIDGCERELCGLCEQAEAAEAGALPADGDTMGDRHAADR